MTLVWIIIFVVSLAVMVKGADWFLDAAEKIGLSYGLSPFVIGVLIVGLGTSFPELISSLAAIIRGATEIVVANAAGSNIANILLVLGLSAIAGRRLMVTKSLIDLDIPLLAISTALFLGVTWDGTVTLIEAIFLLATYGVYFAYTIFHEDDRGGEDFSDIDILPSRSERRGHKTSLKKKYVERPQIAFRQFVILFVGLVGLVVGAKYLIDSVIELAVIFQIGTGVIALAAVALGTSLPEMLVSIRAALNKKSEIALGNIFGSNLFNILVVVGIPGLFKTLSVDMVTVSIGLPFLLIATVLFIISGISRRIHMWEGWMYLLLYVFFIGKLFGFI